MDYRIIKKPVISKGKKVHRYYYFYEPGIETEGRKLKQRLKKEGSEIVTKCHGVKLPAAGERLDEIADPKKARGLFFVEFSSI